MKIAISWSLRLLEVCKCHIDGTGKPSMMKSKAALIELNAKRFFLMLMQVCGWLVNCVPTGRHSKTVVKKLAIQNAAEKAPMHQSMITKLRVGKMREYRNSIDALIAKVASGRIISADSAPCLHLTLAIDPYTALFDRPFLMGRHH